MSNSYLDNMSISFADYYSIDTIEYANEPVTSLPFSVRVINRFMGNGITTVEQVLNSTPESLLKLKGFGANCLDEIRAFCLELQKEECTYQKNTEKNKSNKTLKIFAENIDSIVAGDFSFANMETITDYEKQQLENYQMAYNILGKDFVFDCVNFPEKILPIVKMLDEYQNAMRRTLEIGEFLNNIPYERKNRYAYGYINAFTVDDEERKMLHNVCDSKETSLRSMISNADLENDQIYFLLKRFVKWCSFDIAKEIEQIFNKLYSNDRLRLVINMRSQHKTLEEIGNVLGVTRERVRQLESKAKRHFNKLYSKVRIISKIFAERNGDTVLTPSEITEYCNDYAEDILFLLQSFDSVNYTYDKELDVFIVGDGSLHDKVIAYLETLPDIVPTSSLSDVLNTAQEDDNIPSEMLEKAFLDSYNITGDVYHRNRLSLAKIYTNVVEKHYPNGIKAYDTEEIAAFRAIVDREYGDVGLPSNDRALTARISSVCILCDKGVYRTKKKQYITKELLNRIYKYIVENENPIFLTNTIFSVFEKELVEQGINNKYYLQGILHESFGEKLIFRRDYISKDANVTSIYTAIINFIKKSEYPVDKKQIYEAFPGITEVVIAFAISDPSILNMFGKYLHGSRLQINDSNKKYLKDLIEKYILEKQVFHYKELFDYIYNDDPDLLNRLYVVIPTSLFSVLEYLFREAYQFKRPFIAKYGTKIEDSEERFTNYVLSKDTVSISDITNFARENHYEIYSILDELNGFNETHLIIDKNHFAKIHNVGITEQIAQQIIKIIEDEVKENMLIVNLDCIHKLPPINVPWTEWLIYSVVFKWSTKLEVGTTSNQFRLSTPIIAPCGKLSLEQFAGIDISSVAQISQVDDLDNIDDLISDYIELNLNEELL